MKMIKHVWAMLIVVLLAACPAVVERSTDGGSAAVGGYVATFRQDGSYFRNGDTDSALEWKYYPDSRRFA